MNSDSFFKKKKIKLANIFPSQKFNRNFIIKNVKPLKIAKKDDYHFLTPLSISQMLSQQMLEHVLR